MVTRLLIFIPPEVGLPLAGRVDKDQLMLILSRLFVEPI
jgi:hypothetical protein